MGLDGMAVGKKEWEIGILGELWTWQFPKHAANTSVK